MTNVVIHCVDLPAVLGFYSGPLGFRIESIFPADSPREALLSGHGLTVTLRSGPAPSRESIAAGIVVTKPGAGGFAAGRAGMQYRDLLPGRFGGRVIASHIRIPEGGPVPDYVHHHDIRFQMIFCVRGRVRVVYEDQGEPFWMLPGDCVLQPPHIRHRVLECSDATEVVEIASPAEHLTSVDHDMALPNATVDAMREFGGQPFVFSEASRADWRPANVPGLEVRDTGIDAATRSAASAVVLRSAAASGNVELAHDGDCRFIYVLNGEARLGNGPADTLSAGDACTVPPGFDCRLEPLSAGFEVLDVRLRGL